MVAIIIGSTSGSTSTTSGLTAGAGLSFGVGLILGFAGFTGIGFHGSGNFSSTTRETERDVMTLAGAGSLSAHLTGPIADLAAFPGTSSALFAAFIYKQALATFPGTSTLTGNAIKAISANFAGSGSLSATVTAHLQASLNFAGTGGRQGV